MSTETRKAGQSYDTTSNQRRLYIDAMVRTGRDTTQSALDAGFSKHSAAPTGRRLYRIDWIRQEIDRRVNDLLGVTDDGLIDAIADIGLRADLADYDNLTTGMTLSQLREKGVNTKVIKTYKFTRDPKTDLCYGTIELYDRLNAQDKLIRIKGLDKSAGQSDGSNELVAAIAALAASTPTQDKSLYNRPDSSVVQSSRPLKIVGSE